MKSYRKELWFEVPSRRGYVNITNQVEICLAESQVREGLVLVNAMHITASVFINDNESGLHHDYDQWLEKLAPHEPVSSYRHNQTGEDNADAHMKRQLMGREVVVAITAGRLDFARRTVDASGTIVPAYAVNATPGRIPLIDGSATGKGDSPDAAFYDAPNQLFYIGNGGASANLPDSTISIFSVEQGKVIGTISIPGNNVESMGIDSARHRLFVNIRDKQQVGVVDLDSRKLLTTWTAPGMNKNTALVVDETTHRVFVAGRTPGMLYVFDEDGKVVAKMPCVNINDDMHFDPELKRLYISGSQGLNVFHQDSPDRYTELAQIPTNGGKTSTYVSDLHQLYVIHPKTSIDTAVLLVYRVNP